MSGSNLVFMITVNCVPDVFVCNYLCDIVVFVFALFLQWFCVFYDFVTH